jgi:hypothetical protein
MFLLFTTVFTTTKFLCLTIAENKLLALSLGRLERRQKVVSDATNLVFSAVNLRFLNAVTFLSAVRTPDDKIFRGQPRDVFIMNHTYIYEQAYWSEYGSIVSVFYDKTFVLLLTILVLSLFAIEARYRSDITYFKVYGRFGNLMYYRQFVTALDSRITGITTVISLVGLCYIFFEYYVAIDRYARIAAICDQSGLASSCEAYIRSKGVTNLFNTMRMYQWESIYHHSNNLSYRRTRPVRWLGSYFPHFNPEFRKYALTRFSYEQLRDVYIHAQQLSAGIIRLPEAERVRAILYIKNVVQANGGSGPSSTVVSMGTRLLQNGKID